MIYVCISPGCAVVVKTTADAIEHCEDTGHTLEQEDDERTVTISLESAE